MRLTANETAVATTPAGHCIRRIFRLKIPGGMQYLAECKKYLAERKKHFGRG
jgi:hypothetical protein